MPDGYWCCRPCCRQRFGQRKAQAGRSPESGHLPGHDECSGLTLLPCSVAAHAGDSAARPRQGAPDQV